MILLVHVALYFKKIGLDYSVNCNIGNRKSVCMIARGVYFPSNCPTLEKGMFKVLNQSKNLSSKETFLKLKKSEEMFFFSFFFLARFLVPYSF